MAARCRSWSSSVLELHSGQTDHWWWAYGEREHDDELTQSVYSKLVNNDPLGVKVDLWLWSLNQFNDILLFFFFFSFCCLKSKKIFIQYDVKTISWLCPNTSRRPGRENLSSCFPSVSFSFTLIHAPENKQHPVRSGQPRAITLTLEKRLDLVCHSHKQNL